MGAKPLDKNFAPVVLKLVAIVTMALPVARKVDIFWAYLVVSGALLPALARSRRIERSWDGQCRSDAFAAVKAGNG